MIIRKVLAKVDNKCNARVRGIKNKMCKIALRSQIPEILDSLITRKIVRQIRHAIQGSTK